MPEETPPPAPPPPAYQPPASQADLDRIVEQRLARERAKFADYEDLKVKATKFEELDAATKSELQKANDAIAERDRQLADLPVKARRDAIRFASMATQKGFLDPEDALVFIDVDLADEAAVATALEQLAERKPHLVRQQPTKKLPPRPKPEGSGGTGTPDPNELQGKERAAAALRQFRTTR